MNKLDTTIQGGYPRSLEDLGFMQSSTIDAFKGLLSSFGANIAGAVILSGCQRNVSGGNVTVASGYVSIDGEVLFFPEQVYPTPGLTTYEYFDVQSSDDPNGDRTLFNGGATVNAYEVRVAQIVLASSVPSGHTKYENAKTIYQLIDENTDGVPTGAIIMWSGAINEIPASYSLCDGSNNTPDLRGRFIVGYNNQDSDFDLDSTGGEKTHTLTSSEIPTHQHTFGLGTSDSGDVNDPDAIIVPTATQGNHAYDPISTQAATDGNANAGAAHNNLPPYYALAFIKKVGTSVPNNTPVTQSS